jgi:molybdopterin converting factor small subunit
MPNTRKTTEELIAEEGKKVQQLRARMAELKARQKAEERKRDNHRKIVVGAAIMTHIKIDGHFRKEVRDALNLAVTDPKHRSVIPDLLDEQAFQEAQRAAAKKAAVEAAEAAEAAGAANEAPEAVRPSPQGKPDRQGPRAA